jgi:DinB superfamily
MSRMARPASSKTDSRQTFALLAKQYGACHKALLSLVEELPQDQFRWRPTPGPQSIGWNLWHAARWDDYLAQVLVEETTSRLLSIRCGVAWACCSPVAGAVRSDRSACRPGRC